MKRLAYMESRNAIVESLLADLKESNSHILSELRPNGGHSMRDEMRSIGDTIARISARSRVAESALSFGTFGMDANMHWAYVNAMVCEMTGKEEGELCGMGWVNVIFSDDQDFCKRQIKAAILDEREMDVNFRIVVNEENKSHRKVRCIIKPVKNGDRVIFYTGTLKTL